MGIRARSAWLPAVSAAATCTAHFTSHCLLRWPHRRLMSAAACNAHCRFANAWTRLGLTQSLAELPAGLLDSPELVSSSSYAASGSLPSSTSASGGGGSALDTTAYAPGSQVRGRRGFMSAVVAAAQASLQQLCWQRTSHQRVQAACYAAFCRRPRPSLPTPEAPKCSPRLHSAHCTPATPATPAPLPASPFPVQKMRVEGEVLRWHHENGKEVVPALQYIEQLEAELADLRQQVGHCVFVWLVRSCSALSSWRRICGSRCEIAMLLVGSCSMLSAGGKTGGCGSRCDTCMALPVV